MFSLCVCRPANGNGGGCCSQTEGPRLGLILPRSTEHTQPPPALSGIRKAPAPWAHLRLPLIDSLIRNEQRCLVLWVIVIFVTPQKQAVSASSFCDLIGQSYQTVNSSRGAASVGDPYPLQMTMRSR